MSPATAFTSSLCHVAVTKSGSRSTANRGPRSVSASRPAAGPSGSTSRTGVRSLTQPPGCVSAENHTTDGTTVDSGQYLPTRSTCSTPFCSAHTTVLSSHSRASHAAACSILGVLDGQEHDVDGPIEGCGVGVHGSGHHDGIAVVGPDLDGLPRGAAAQGDGVSGRVDQGRDRRADGAGSDERHRVVADSGSSRERSSVTVFARALIHVAKLPLHRPL